MSIRPAKTIRDMNRPAWTRFSRSKPRKSYIKSMPHKDLNVFRMGQMKKDFDVEISLEAEDDVLLRDNAIESARQSSNKHLETNIAGSYYFIVRIYPHHIVRENKMIAGAGADRLQKGMRQSFGRPVDCAARVYKNKALFTIYTYNTNREFVKQALRKAMKKLSGSYKIIESA